MVSLKHIKMPDRNYPRELVEWGKHAEHVSDILQWCVTLFHQLTKLLVVSYLNWLYWDNDSVTLSDDVPRTTVFIWSQHRLLHYENVLKDLISDTDKHKTCILSRSWMLASLREGFAIFSAAALQVSLLLLYSPLANSWRTFVLQIKKTTSGLSSLISRGL